MIYMKRKNYIYIFLLISLLITIGIIANQIFSTIYLNRLAYMNHQKIKNNAISVTKNAVYYYLYNIEENLKFLSERECVALFNKDGIEAFDEFYGNFSGIYSNLSRLDTNGVIIHTLPFNKGSIGKNVLYQAHNKLLFETKRTVVSSPFMAVQGYKAIAVAVPVIYKGRFYGTVTGLIPFERIWDLFVSGMNLSGNSFIIVTDENGGFIYSPEFLSDKKNISELSDLLCVGDSAGIFSSGAENEAVDVCIKKNTFRTLRERDYVLIKSSIEVSGQKWHIYDFTPKSDIFSIQRRYFYSQAIFIYLAIILLCLTALTFIFIQSSTIEKSVKIMADTISEKDRINRQKGFIEKVVNSLNLMKDVLIIVTDSSMRVIYSNNDSVKYGKSVFTVIKSRDNEAVSKGFEYIVRNGKASSITVSMLLGGRTDEYLLNIASISYEDEPFMMITGFKRDSLSMNVFSGRDESGESLISILRSSDPVCIIRPDGSIVFSNLLFKKRFENAENLAVLLGDQCRAQMEDAMKSIFEFSSPEAALICSGGEVNIKMTPIMSSMAKIEFICVEIT